MNQTINEARSAFATRPLEVAGLLLLAALTIASYGFARPAAESLFVERYGSANLPWAWLGVGVAAVATTALYNRVVTAVSLVQLWPRAVLVICAVCALLLAATALGVRHAEFALYIWKDLYIVVLVELFWSIANVSFPLSRARWLYGAFLAAGSAGGFCAEVSVGHVASALGSTGAVAVSLPILILTIAMVPFLPAAARVPGKGATVSIGAIASRAVTVLRKSRYLLLLVGLVALVQISLTVIDYQFNVALEAYAPDVDERTGLAGKLYAVISIASLILQVVSGLLIKGFGIPVVIALAPVLLFGGALAFALHPRFGIIAVVKVASKALDYSVGRAAKELLYIPLSYEEKTEGKALVDLLSYRVSKAFASVLLLWIASAELGGGAIVALALGLLAGWLVLALIIGRRFRMTGNE